MRPSVELLPAKRRAFCPRDEDPLLCGRPIAPQTQESQGARPRGQDAWALEWEMEFGSQLCCVLVTV